MFLCQRSRNFKNVLRVNVVQAKPIKITPEFYYAIAKEGIEVDKPLGFINQNIAKGIQLLISAWSLLVEADTKYRDANPGAKSTNLQIVDGLSLNISEIADFFISVTHHTRECQCPDRTILPRQLPVLPSL